MSIDGIMWLVWCPACLHNGTVGLPPDHPDFEPKINCVTCNRLLDAKKGYLQIEPVIVGDKEEIDLLEVE